MNPRRVLVLVNRRARQGTVDMAALRAVLERAGCETVLHTPDDAHEMCRIIRHEGRANDAVVIGGGDGTIGGVAGALIEVGKPFGILPLGTANDLARTLGIPRDPIDAAEVIIGGRTRRIDVGRINDRYFFNVASLGLSVRLAHTLDYGLKQRWGAAGYFLALLRLELGPGFHAEITWPEGEIRLHSAQVSIGNGRHHGGGVVVAPEARIDDGKLHVYAIPHLPAWRLLLILPFLRLGRQHLLKEVWTLETERLEIRTALTLRVNTDGEVTTTTPAHVAVIRAALEVFVPPPVV